jgi:hypothetical protein
MDWTCNLMGEIRNAYMADPNQWSLPYQKFESGEEVSELYDTEC